MKHNSALNTILQTKFNVGYTNAQKISVFMVKCCKQTAQQRQEIQSEINLNKRKEGDLRIMSPLAWMRKELILG